MGKFAKILTSVQNATADCNLAFNDLRHLLRNLDFKERVKGSHHIFWRDGIPEILNLQPNGSDAKPYQVKQVRELILRYDLAQGDDADE